MRHLLTKNDWRLILEELMRRDLIDLPDFYYDQIPLFKGPNELTDQFTTIERDNLLTILRIQET